MNLNKKIAIQTQDIILNDKEFNQKYVFPTIQNLLHYPNDMGSSLKKKKDYC